MNLNNFFQLTAILCFKFNYDICQLGGPSWTVGLGRRDSTTASKDVATQDIPSPLMDLSALISAFSKKGFTTKEVVALSGKLLSQLKKVQYYSPTFTNI